LILEGLVTTVDTAGTLNIAPMGPKVDPQGSMSRFVLRPFRDSTTYRNLKATGEGVLHVTDDVRLIARTAIGDAVEVASRPADRVRGRILTSCCRYYEFQILDCDDQSERAEMTAETVASGRLRDYFGLNRAKHAVIEAAILATRVAFKPEAEIRAEFERLAVPIEKTGGPMEREAFEFLKTYIDRSFFEFVRNGTIRLEAPSRLHFGPLCWKPGAARRFGGLGLMVERPGLVARAEPAEAWSFAGPLRERVERVVSALRANWPTPESEPPPSRLVVERVPQEHVGLGTGTQLALTVAKAVASRAGWTEASAVQLAELVGRGVRSGVGIHGFEHGGLIVEGGHGPSGGLPPLIVRKRLPDDWFVLLIIPPGRTGPHGQAEQAAFERLPPMPESLVDHLCRLVLIELLPAVEERDLPRFGAVLTAIQQEVGHWFEPAQGGTFGGQEGNAMIATLKNAGLVGVGQSSWGPTLYGFSAEDAATREMIAEAIRDRFGLDRNHVSWTKATSRGVRGLAPLWEA